MRRTEATRSEVGVGLARLRSDVATKGSGTMPFGGRGSPSARRFLVFASARAALLSYSLKLKLCFAYFFPRSLANRSVALCYVLIEPLQDKRLSCCLRLLRHGPDTRDKGVWVRSPRFLMGTPKTVIDLFPSG
jgi:hypothetical protein